MVLFGGLWGNDKVNNRNNNSDDDDISTAASSPSFSSSGTNEDVVWPDEEQPSLTAEFDSDDTSNVMKLCAFYLTSYVVVAIIAYSFVFERWSIIDSIYFATSTFTTVGYGDLQVNAPNVC
jgi:hypothetical protein